MKNLALIAILFLAFACKNQYTYDPNESVELINTPTITPIVENRAIHQLKIIKGTYNAVYFTYNSYKIDAVYKLNLTKIADYLKNNPNYSLDINGHTDSKGSKKYNRKLSQQRADAVKNFLSSLGIENSRLKSSGFASSQPNHPENSPRDQAYNRRVEVHFTKQ